MTDEISHTAKLDGLCLCQSVCFAKLSKQTLGRLNPMFSDQFELINQVQHEPQNQNGNKCSAKPVQRHRGLREPALSQHILDHVLTFKHLYRSL
ncbi:hypothetical protein A6X21_00715 [Planctopirus hydrillae]|uniref:Uncharacterized protein n=1 Tax=Planctopirus hydrillae TaxID=1841610 RepID=A0A1C3EB27_9PLAN|nr:hypothetical protein A6X21_00715 [Planctopirus hydrillae]